MFPGKQRQRNRDLPRPTSRVVSVLLTLALLSSTAALAGGVRVVDMRLSDNGDDDGYADTNETVGMRLRLWNATGIDLTGVTARLYTTQSHLACLLTPEIDIGDLAAGESRLTAESFVFLVPPDVERTDLEDDLWVAFDVLISSDQLTDSAVPETIVIDLDLDVADGSGPTVFFEGFEVDSGYGQFTPMNMDDGLYDPSVFVNPSIGYRCQYHVDDNECEVGVSEAHAQAFFWEIDGPAAPDGGRSFSGTRSLHMGTYVDGERTTPLSTLEAVRNETPIHLGWEQVCEDDRNLACDDQNPCPGSQACVPTAPTLSFKHQISLMDSRHSNAPAGEAVDRGVVHLQVAGATGDPVGDWVKIYPYLNVYDQLGTDDFSNCKFDPIDDGNDENDWFDPFDPLRRFGPSSTCFPARVFVALGDTDDPFDPANVANAAGPGLEGAMGPGTWVESRFDLSRFRGRSVRIRFLTTTIEIESATSYPETTLDAGPGDDGWWIDDVVLTDALTSQTTVSVDTKDNSSLPVGLSDGDGDGIFDDCDNCAASSNSNQRDEDFDEMGDVCDPCPEDPLNDGDGDGTCAQDDNCPVDPNSDQSDVDDDGFGDVCDNCPLGANPDQGMDEDDDTVLCPDDNCPQVPNQSQRDTDDDGVGDECDFCLDMDGDSYGNPAWETHACADDCDDGDGNTFPDAPEVNDARDNQCPGDTGYGSVDEISPDTGFKNAADRNEYSWTGQQGATLYRVVRSDTIDFTTGCMIFERTGTTLVDAELPLPGEVFHYLVHPLAPHEGSYGQNSAGSERVVPCAP